MKNQDWYERQTEVMNAIRIPYLKLEKRIKRINASRKVVKLCHKEDCCPTLTKEGSRYILTDDFGGRVVLTRNESRILIVELYKMLYC
jgi:hypothetical protein